MWIYIELDYSIKSGYEMPILWKSSNYVMEIWTEIWTNATYLNSSLHYVDSVVDIIVRFLTTPHGLSSIPVAGKIWSFIRPLSPCKIVVNQRVAPPT